MFSKALHEKLEEFKAIDDMHKEVIEDIIDGLDGNETDKALYEAVDQICTYGCASGIVDSMVYYSSTTTFFERHKETINEYLAELLGSTGLSLKEFFKRFDDEDPLCLETYNQNLLAWYGYELVANSLYNIVEDYV